MYSKFHQLFFTALPKRFPIILILFLHYYLLFPYYLALCVDIQKNMGVLKIILAHWTQT